MITLLLLASAPVLIILLYVYYRDKYEREPVKLLLESLLAGGVIVFPILWGENLAASLNVFNGQLTHAFYQAFVVAAFNEELLKFLAALVLIWRNPNFNEKFDGIVYAVFVSLGFALVENVMYVFGAEDGIKVGIARMFTAVPAHAMFGIMMGYWLGIARFSTRLRVKGLLLALMFPILFHGIYDFILMSGSRILLFFFFPFVIFLLLRAKKRIKNTETQSPFNPENLT